MAGTGISRQRAAELAPVGSRWWRPDDGIDTVVGHFTRDGTPSVEFVTDHSWTGQQGGGFAETEWFVYQSGRTRIVDEHDHHGA